MVRPGAVALTVTCLCFTMAAPAVASDSTVFKISSYKPTKFVDFEWRLDGGASMGNEGSASNTDYAPGASRNSSLDTSSTNFDGLGDILSYWRFRHESIQWHFYLSVAFDGSIDYSSHSRLQQVADTLGTLSTLRGDSSATSYLAITTVTGELRTYLVSDLSLSGILSFRHTYKDTYTRSVSTRESESYSQPYEYENFYFARDDNRTRSLAKTIDLDGEAYVGWGRVYEGQYASSALFLVDELRYRGVLDSEPSYDEMVWITEIVRKYRLSHLFDERKFRASALTTFVEYLSDHDLIADMSARNLLVIEDVWDYFPAPSRQFGWIVRFGFGGTDEYSSNLSNRDTKSYKLRTYRYSGTPEILDTALYTDNSDYSSNHNQEFTPQDRLIGRIEYYRPLSTRWQWNNQIQVRYYIHRNQKPDAPRPVYYDEKVNHYVCSMAAELHYYHDSRHEAVINAGATYAHIAYKNHRPSYTTDGTFSAWKIESNDYVDWDGTVSLSYLIRLAAATRLEVVAGYRYLGHTDDVPDYTTHSHENNLSFSLSLTHWLF